MPSTTASAFSVEVQTSVRVSNEPCVDEKYCRRCELARKRMKDFSDTYGECRDSEQMPCICEPVGMANCVQPDTT